MRKITCIAQLCIVLILVATGCSKDDKKQEGNALLQVRLTDAPADFEKVQIDVKDVQIHVSADSSNGGWVSLHVNAGVYNLLDFRDGMDTLLASMELPAGQISQMRLVLGSNNSIRIGGTDFALATPSAQQSGLKFNIDAELKDGIIYTLWIDFDAGRSVVKKGNGGYSLKPVIRTFTKAITGAIKGNVFPAAALPYVMAVNNGDTLGTYASAGGDFLIKGLPAATYSVIFKPVSGYRDTTITGVTVTTGNIVQMDTIRIRNE